MSSTAGYGEAADTLAEQYESVSFADVHRDVLHLFPTEPSSILDIGAGTGRDAAALSDLGHRVVAVEPTPQLRAHGQRIHAANDIEWVDDALPDLTVLCKRGQRFNLILLTAVWMHLDQHERSSAMEHISGLLLPEGRVVISLRHGPVPAGRRMYDVSTEETVTLARHLGLRLIHDSERADPLGRHDVHWSYLGLQLQRIRLQPGARQPL